eukprot:CAMPEP_0167745460 /NCGR_PEP_ID=MMETSP0110_2-20121227/3163_1 /TAXON_ID=629695 /ORGANISM="Gymnochlora sp., Strain CCMP2014" /LENGTH=167 /DNA_ID=CAMNT_0007630103 /DNA_START=1 /DNA_END=501 /DNA_ORIENTATION=+
MAAGLVRKFALPIERPGARYMTRLQRSRIAKAAADSVQRVREGSQFRGLTSLSVLLDLTKRPINFIYRHRIKFIVLIFCGGTSAFLLLVSMFRKMRDEVRRRRAELKRIETLLESRLESLRKLNPKHWNKIYAEIRAEIADRIAVGEARLTKVESYIGMMFDELLTL